MIPMEMSKDDRANLVGCHPQFSQFLVNAEPFGLIGTGVVPIRSVGVTHPCIDQYFFSAVGYKKRTGWHLHFLAIPDATGYINPFVKPNKSCIDRVYLYTHRISSRIL